MKCPNCKDTVLKPTKLESGLPAMGCGSCEGSFVSLLYYRDWAERHSEPLEVDEIELKMSEEADTHTARTCPKCSRFMTKFQITGDSKNRLDLCTSYDEAWLDGGEWELLKALALSQKMPLIFTDSWQTKVRQQKVEESRRQRYIKLVGEADVERADEIRHWLNDHPKRPELLFYIGLD